MILRVVHDGGADPFEGERELVLRRLPADARVIAARATVTPVDASRGSDPFAEEIAFRSAEGGSGALGDWGTTQVSGPGWAEIDFHARRTLAGLRGNGLTDAGLQVDLGGSFVRVDEDGALAAPGAQLLELTNDGPLPGIAASRVRVAIAGSNPPTPRITAVRIRSLPTNVTLALAGRPALWFQVGELAAPVTTPDFGPLLAAYLADGAEAVEGAWRLPFLLRSDAIARLVVAIEIEYLRRAPLLPPGLPEVKLGYDHSTAPRPGSAPLVVALPAGAVPVAAASEGRVTGPFGETRIAWGPIGPAGDTARDDSGEASPVAEVSPSRTLAQPLNLAGPYEITGVDLLLGAIDRQVKLQLDLRIDDDGKPGVDSLLTAPVPFALARAASASEDTGEAWIAVELPRPLTLRDQRVWLLLQSEDGRAAWGVGAAAVGAVGALPLQVSADGGFSYRQAFTPAPGDPDLAALLRLREQPRGFRMPLSIALGNGPRIDLSRLSPLGRVDFALSTPELAAGLAATLALTNAASGGAIPGGELLADRRFARWEVTGDELGPPRVFPLGPGEIAFVAMAPDGRTAFLALGVREALQLVAWDTESETIAWRLETDVETPRGLVIAPDGRFAYVLLSGGIAVIDLAGRRLLGAPVAGQGTEARLLSRITDLDLTPAAVAFSPDGARLYVLTENRDASGVSTGELLAFDARNLDGAPARAQLGRAPRALAVAPDGRSVLVLQRDRLDRYDATALTPEASLPLNDDSTFRVVAVAPGGRRALLAGCFGLAAVALSPTGMRLLTPPGVFGESTGLTVSPQGDRAVVAQAGAAGVLALLIPIGTPRPLDWTATAGRVRPLSLTGLAGLGVRLGEAAASLQSTLPTNAPPPPGPSAVSQVVAIVAGRTYELAFRGRTTGEAVAEVLWRGAEGEQLGEAAVLIEARTSEPSVLHRGRFPAPPGALAAEVRFVSREGLTLIDSPSFREPANALANADLLGAPADGTGWNQEPPSAPGFLLSPVEAGSRVRNAGAVPVVFRQQVAIAPRALSEPPLPFELVVRASLEAVPAGGEAPRVELRFLAADGSALGSSSAITVPARGFGEALAAGLAPANAARAEVALTMPPGAALVVSGIELNMQSPVYIPVTFLAEAPGELAVIGGAVAWDLLPSSPSTASPAPRPGPPLPAPTPPPGAVNEDEDCGCGDAPAGSEPAPAPAPAPVVPAPVEPRVLVGIGPRRAEILREQGITTLNALIAADPGELARILPSVSERMVVDFLRQAREILRSG